MEITDHNNLTFEQKEVLGWIHSHNVGIQSLIFEFENSKYKDYEKLAHEIVHKTTRRKVYIDQSNEMNIPEANIRAFNRGLVKGLVNPNRLSYIAYYE